VLIYLHGGGWVAGSLETVDAACRRLAVTSGHPVLSVDYRLAPEHPWPAAVEDADTVIGWIRDYGTERGLDPARIGVAGDSAGGTLAAVAARRQRDAGTPLAFQGLVYPVVDPSAKTESYREFAVGYGLDAELMARFWELYVPEKANRAHPDAAPRCAESLAGLPPALIVTAEYDVLRDEGEEYAAALSEAGVPTVTIRYAGMVHSFFRKVALFDAAGVAIDQVALAARAALAHATPVPR
jgi:acetyl esterase